MTNFIPTFDILLPALLFYICRFESQRWRLARLRGYRDDHYLIASIVDSTRIIAWIFSCAFLVVFGLQFGIKPAIGLFVIVGIIGFAYSGISTLIMRGESLLVWILGTFGVYPTGLWLSTKVTWF